jgi:hypothetical protein
MKRFGTQGVSYTTFSPSPLRAVIFFFPHQPSPTASIFRSGVSCAARTFLSPLLSETPAASRGSASRCKGMKISIKRVQKEYIIFAERKKFIQ